MRKTLSFLFVFFLLSAGSLHAQIVKNPRTASFTSIDHDRATGYELDVLRPDGTVLTTIVISKANTALDTTTGIVTASINVQPIDFGQYTCVIRTVVTSGATTVKSENSPVSNQWERSPGPPSKPDMK